MVTGTGTIGKTSVQRLCFNPSAQVHRHCGSYGTYKKWQMCRNASAREDLRAKHQHCIIEIHFGRSSFNRLFVSLPKDRAPAQTAFFSFICLVLFYSSRESSSLKHVTTPVTWGATYRHTINYVKKRE